jgi:hypothetical protein
MIQPGIFALLPDMSIDFTLAPNRTVYYLKLDGPGMISAQATWSGTQPSLALIINGPGQVGYYARQDGGSGLSVSYNVTPADYDAGALWQITVVSFGAGVAQNGQITINYPGGSVQDSFYTMPDAGRLVAVMPLEGAGTISGTAEWTGNPANLALIINGPGQVGYYARQDGPSQLSVSYEVTNADFATGNQWRLSLTSFSAPNAQGQLRVSYP